VSRLWTSGIMLEQQCPGSWRSGLQRDGSLHCSFTRIVSTSIFVGSRLGDAYGRIIVYCIAQEARAAIGIMSNANLPKSRPAADAQQSQSQLRTSDPVDQAQRPLEDVQLHVHAATGNTAENERSSGGETDEGELTGSKLGRHAYWVRSPSSVCSCTYLLPCRATGRMHVRMQEEAYQAELANFADHGDEGEVWCAPS
jgi:hypothetical protein